MILFLLPILIFIIIGSSYLFFSFYGKYNHAIDRKKTKYLFLLSLVFIIILPIVIYVGLSNYWIGEGVINKLVKNKTIKNQRVLDFSLFTEVVKELEEKLEVDPKNLENLDKLARAKFLIGDFLGSADAYKIARNINPSNLDYLIGEAQSRVFFEEEDISEYSLNLFKIILEKDSKNPLALAILAESFSNKKNYETSREYYLRLLRLLEKDSIKYNNIKNKVNKVENKLNDKKTR